MQWLALTLVVTIMTSCCDAGPVASDLSRALGAVLEEDTTMGKGKQKLLFFELIVVFCFNWSVVKHESVLLFFLNVRNLIVWTQINFPLQHIPCQILNFQSSRSSWPAARHSDTECWPTRANTTDCVSGWNRAKHCRPCLGAGGSHVCRNTRRAVLLWILCLYAQVRSIILRN